MEFVHCKPDGRLSGHKKNPARAGVKLVAGPGFEPGIPHCGIMRTDLIFKNAGFIGLS
jgi:hypothetical protein